MVPFNKDVRKYFRKSNVSYPLTADIRVRFLVLHTFFENAHVRMLFSQKKLLTH